MLQWKRDPIAALGRAINRFHQFMNFQCIVKIWLCRFVVDDSVKEAELGVDMGAHPAQSELGRWVGSGGGYFWTVDSFLKPQSLGGWVRSKTQSQFGSIKLNAIAPLSP